ncbi:MAG TPA: hypothetical protein VHI75_10085 [Casimicrobiaceae bacterium]|nr:hypothetical protein [Casimicrobiaceae bacterium]
MALEQNAGTAIDHSTPVARGVLPPLSDHACFIFVPIRISPRAKLAEAELTLQDRLTAASRVRSEHADDKPPDALPWLAASERETLLAEGRQTRIWEPAPMNVGPDLYPHVRRMLGDAATANDTNALCFRLADLPRRLLQGRSLSRRSESEQGPNDKQARRKLVLLLSASARSRIGARLGGGSPDALELHIEDMQLVVYRTGFGIVVAQVSLRTLDGSPLPPYCLVESVASLARFNKLAWRHAAGDSPASTAPTSGETPFTFSEIVSSLHAGEDIGDSGRRLFTTTYAQFSHAPGDAARRHFALQLARHYSDDYRIADSIEGTRTVADFENVLHVISMEGCATIVDLTPPPGLTVPEFVVNFKSVTFERTYLAIMVLAYHEFIALLHFSNGTKFWFGDGDDRLQTWAGQRTTPQRGAKPSKSPAVDREAAFGTLARLRDDILRFRLCYRFSHVSYSTAHNAVYEALRDVWGCARMLTELGQDTAEITAVLDEGIREENARRVRFLGVIGAAGLAYVSAVALIAHTPTLIPWDRIATGMPRESLPAWLRLDGAGLKNAGAIAFALAVSALAGLVAWVKTRRPEFRQKGSELLDRAVEEVVLDSLERK